MVLGLFHDIGRFEQWKLYQTYNDKLSINHGKLGAEMLSSFLDKFNFSQRENEIMLETIKWHEEIYQWQDGEIKFYHSIVRNCDAFANVFTTANGAQQMTVENNGVTKKFLMIFVILSHYISTRHKQNLMSFNANSLHILC